MTINSLTSGSAASQLSYLNTLNSTSNSTSVSAGNGQTEGVRPPPPRDGGGFIGAIADALKSIGVSGTDSGTNTNSTTSTDSTTNAAQALGSFLQNLMGALHEQGGEQSGPPPYGEQGQGGPGGPGRLAEDLQSLISRLGSSSTDSASDTDSADSTDSATSTTSTDDSVSSLESSFKDLLQALGSDTSNSSDQLTGFLQALSSKLPNSGASGNLINTKA